MHKYLCVQIADQHDVVAVLHPSPTGRLPLGRIRSMAKDFKKYGAPALVLQKLTGVPFLRLGWNRQQSVQRAQRRVFADVDGVYEQRVAPLAHDVEDINAPEATRLLSGLRADV